MKPFCLHLVLALGLATSIPAVAQDSLVTRNDLRFKSTLERKNYVAYFQDKDKLHFPYLLLAAKDTINEVSVKKVTDEIAALVNSLKIMGVEKRKPKRKVQEIYDFIHSTMLKKYSLVCRFNEIFTTGTYNCVTATALYALIFEALNVPYEIKEKPTHVFLLAYPNQDNIVIETTTPLFGYMTFDAQYKQNFISTLKSLKLVTEDEIGQKTQDEIFNTYYFKDEKINLENLVGIHYLNDALFRNDEQDHQGAFRQIEKAYWLYPATKTEYLLKTLGIGAAASNKLSPKEKSELVVKVARYKILGVTNDMVTGEFINLTQDVLFRNNNRTLYNECYAIFHSGIKDKELSDEIAYVYYHESGRAFYNQGSLRRAKPFFQKALSLQPNNVDMNRLFLNTLMEAYRTITDSRVILDSLSYYKKTFPTLGEYETFNTVMGEAMLGQMDIEFSKGNAVDGNKYRLDFEALAKSNPDNKIRESSIGRAYFVAISYYKRKGQAQKSKDVLNSGLLVSPSNYQLNQLKR